MKRYTLEEIKNYLVSHLNKDSGLLHVICSLTDLNIEDAQPKDEPIMCSICYIVDGHSVGCPERIDSGNHHKRFFGQIPAPKCSKCNSVAAQSDHPMCLKCEELEYEAQQERRLRPKRFYFNTGGFE